MTLPALSDTLAGLAPALKNHLWQSTLFALVAALLTLALRRNQARTRYWLWLAASLKFLLPFSLLMAFGSHLATRHASPPAPTVVFYAIDEISQPFSPDLTVRAAPTRAHANPKHLVPIIFAGIWFTGFVAVLATWFVFWKRIRTTILSASPLNDGRELEMLRRMERAAGLRTPIHLLASQSPLGPGIFGIFRPKLIWPAAISHRLSDAHLEAVLAHEITHVRRHDNLTAALHMLVEALFWFHPFVWIIGTRLEAERERACDEAVLAPNPVLNREPHIYAESILKICEFYTEPVLPCVSGVTRADLKQRIAQILADRTALQLTIVKKLILTATAFLFVAVPLVLGRANATRPIMPAAVNSAPMAFRLAARAMMPSVDTPSTDLIPTAHMEAAPVITIQGRVPSKVLNFGLVSIHATHEGGNGSWGSLADGYHVTHLPLSAVIQLAYFSQNVHYWRKDQVAGRPSWTDTGYYDIQAKIAPEDIVEWQDSRSNPKVYGAMLQRMLEEYFKLSAHLVPLQRDGWALVVAKQGAKLKKAPSEELSGTSPTNAIPFEGGGWMIGSHADGGDQWKYTAASIVSLAEFLSNYQSGTVVDRTGLRGKYTFTILRSDQAPIMQSSDPRFWNLEQLGLELKPIKIPSYILVIDHIEKPSAGGAEVTDASVMPAASTQERASTSPVFRDSEASTPKLSLYDKGLEEN